MDLINGFGRASPVFRSESANWVRPGSDVATMQTRVSKNNSQLMKGMKELVIFPSLVSLETLNRGIILAFNMSDKMQDKRKALLFEFQWKNP